MKKPALRLVAGLLLLLGLWFAAETVAYFGNLVLPWQRSALETTVAWGGLAPFPDTAAGLSVSTTGTSFTRTFDVSFTAPAADISRWIERSPRLQKASPTRTCGNRARYEVRPGEQGAIGGWVEVDWSANRVTVQMSWS